MRVSTRQPTRRRLDKSRASFQNAAAGAGKKTFRAMLTQGAGSPAPPPRAGQEAVVSGEGGFEQLLGELRIGAGAAFHQLAEQEAQERDLAAAVGGDLVGVVGDHR